MQFGGLYLRRHRKIRRIKAGVSRMPSGLRSAEDLPYTFTDLSPADIERQGMQREMTGVRVELEDLKGLLGNLITQRDESRQHARREQGSNRSWLWGDGRRGSKELHPTRLKFEAANERSNVPTPTSRDGSSGQGSGLSVAGNVVSSWNLAKQHFGRPRRALSWWNLERRKQLQQLNGTAAEVTMASRRCQSLEPRSDRASPQQPDDEEAQHQDLEMQYHVPEVAGTVHCTGREA